MRARMTEADRKAARRAKWAAMRSGAAYRHYDPADPAGSRADWQAGAELLLRSLGFDAAQTTADEGLRILSPTYRPTSRAELVGDFRAAAKATHPDYGGTNEGFRRVVEAFERLKARFGW